MEEFGVSEEVYTLGISLFVLGFAVGCVPSMHISVVQPASRTGKHLIEQLD